MNKKNIQNILIPLLLTFFLATFYLKDIETVRFHPDESQWIGSSQVFEEYFNARFDSPYFEESYWTLTQPPITRYFIGVGRTIGGYGQKELNIPWNFFVNDEANIQNGGMPSIELLWWSRFPMAVSAITAIMIVFILIREILGNMAGFIWILLVFNNSYFLLHLRRAMGESPLMLFVSLGALICFTILKMLNSENNFRFGKYFVMLIIFGAIAGVAGATKLNGLSVMMAGIVLAIIVAIKRKYTKSQQLIIGIFSILTIIVSSSITFVGVNPYLWPNPIVRAKKMAGHRIGEMREQQKIYPESQIDSIRERVSVVTNRVFKNYAALDFNKLFWLNIVFFLVGLSHIIVELWKSQNKIEIDDAASITLVLISFFVATPMLFTPLDWDRYYIFPVFFTTVFVAIGISVIVKGVRCIIF